MLRRSRCVQIFIQTTFLASFASLFSWAISSRAFFPPRDHKPPPNFRGGLNPHPCLQRCRFPAPRYAKRPGVVLYAIGPLFLLPTLSSPHCTLKTSKHDSLWQPPAENSDERPRPLKSSRADGCLNALTSSYLVGTVARKHPMVWFLVLCPDDAKQYQVVYGASLE